MKHAPLFALVLVGSLAATTLRAQDTPPGFTSDDTLIALLSLMGHKLFLPGAETELGDIDLEELTEPSKDWKMACQVEEIVLRRDGAMQGVVDDVGGLFGKGATRVLSFDDLRFLPDADEENEFFLLLRASRKA